MEGTVTISKDRYFEMSCAEEELSRLKVGGVDNWDWYGDSLNPEDGQDFESWREEEKARIEAM